MKTIEKAKDFIIILGLLVLTLPTFITLLRPGFYPMHDDIQVIRLLEMDKCVKDNQIPCRWVPDMGFGYGYPQFNYYSPLPYYLMEIFHLTGFGFLESIRVFFVLTIVASLLGMYLLGRELWGRVGGVVSSLLYVYAPYFATDIYVRGAVGEMVAYATFPFIFLFIGRLVNKKSRSILGLALAFTTLFTSHNISTLFFTPVSLLWFLLLNYLQPEGFVLSLRKSYKKFILSFVWGFGLAAYFLIPAWFEKGLVKTETLTYGYFNYVSHFVGLKQLLFNSFWGYGSSQAGAYDQIFLGIGIVYWVFPIVALFLLIFFKEKKGLLIVTFLFASGWLSAFLIHPKSVFIWDSFPILSYFQFPWRFLLLITFLFSFAAGSISLVIPKSKKFVFGFIVTIYAVVTLFYASFFRPSKWLDLTDKDKFSGESWQLQQTISINDYLPIFAKNAPNKVASDKPEIIQGEATILEGSSGTNWQMWKIRVSEDNSLVKLQILYFPNWKVWVNDKEAEINYDNEFGIITLNLDKGEYEVWAKLTDTPVRILGNLITILALISIPLYIKKTKGK